MSREKLVHRISNPGCAVLFLIMEGVEGNVCMCLLFSDQGPLNKVSQAAKNQLQCSSPSNSEKQPQCNMQRNRDMPRNGAMTENVLVCSHLRRKEKGEFLFVHTWWWWWWQRCWEQCLGWGTRCFIPMKNTILYSGQSFSRQWERAVTMDSFYSKIPVRTSKSLLSLD